MNNTQSVMMSRAEAETYFDMLLDYQQNIVRRIAQIDRMRKFSDAIKLQAVAKMNVDLQNAKALCAKIGEAFSIGGY